MKKITLLFGLILFLNGIFAQDNYTLYYMYLPQATELNPARQHHCAFYLGLPAISTFATDFTHRGFRYIDLFDYNNYTLNNQDTSFNIDLEKVYNALEPVNYIFSNNKTNILNFAFWTRSDLYITFDIYHHDNFALTYPQNLFLIKDGNYFDDTTKYISLTNLGIDLNVYNEVSLGISKEITSGLTIGGKIKFLQGIANITTKKSQLDWHVNTTDGEGTYDWRFNTSFDIRTNIDSSFFDTNLTTMQKLAPFYSFQNWGLGLDLGAIYEYKNFEFSAAITDFGFITWKSSPVVATAQQGTFVFPGLDLARYITDYGIATSLKDQKIRDSIINLAISDLKDTVLKQVQPDIENKKYSSGINTKLHFGFAYEPKEWITLGFYYRGMFFHKKLLSTYTLSSNLKFWNGWNLALSYTMFKKSFNNVGLGLSYKLGPLQMYLISDNIAPYWLGLRYLTAYDKPFNEGIATNWVKSSRMFNLRFGINFTFGCTDRLDYGLLDDFDLK